MSGSGAPMTSSGAQPAGRPGPLPSRPRAQKPGRCVSVHEATRTGGFGAELSALVQERCFYHLEGPVLRVTGWDTPYPHSLEWAYFPGHVRVGLAFKKALED